ncbi:arylmalonate decarboxylase [Sediminicoccus sp. KRV36]|uniref:maleate cis-trans isomerase family protein n=1 Tax=Sediminicoccus sp. KRV36 TaxID=3133721 RepID=UPI00200E5609|nr:arylmalonate decarboxylase [Sediminicoccus rosea]UPY36280.1 arylmalonate decarboxylase [Sediminicoccus rosea]
MPDVLGWRATFGVVTPSTNTVVQPEYDSLRPVGVTNHVARMHIPNDPVQSDADFDELIRRIDAAMEGAIERVMTAEPDHIILGISAESVWNGGMEAARAIAARVAKLTGGLPFTQAADALPAALKALGISGPVGLVTPYFPVAHAHLASYLKEIGCEVVAARHLERRGPVDIAKTSLADLRAAIAAVNLPEARAIIQFGANLPMGQLAASAEPWLGKPVIAINTATYWHALRSRGITDRMRGCGRLMEEC